MLEWKGLPLSGMIGIPLKFAKWNATDGTSEQNLLVQMLAIPFGCSRTPLQLLDAGLGERNHTPIRGGVVLVRDDGKAFTRDHMEFLHAYVCSVLEDVTAFSGNDYIRIRAGEQTVLPGRIKKKTVYDVLALQEKVKAVTKEMPFAKYWGVYCKERVEKGQAKWKDMRCPPLTLPWSVWMPARR
jgi:hypothetical protein